jgi:hypothetical protein
MMESIKRVEEEKKKYNNKPIYHIRRRTFGGVTYRKMTIE